MQNKIRSYNARKNTELRNLLIPTPSKITLLLVLSIALLTLLNIRAIWRFFTTGVDKSAPVNLGDLINQKFPGFYNFFDDITDSRLAQLLFWLFLGCIAYLAIWLIGSFISNIRNDIVADNYVHPKFYNRAGYWGPVLGRKIFFTCLVVVVIAYILVGIEFFNLLADVCYRATTDFNWFDSIAKIIGSVLLAALSLHIFSILLKLLSNSWQVISKDL